MQSDKQIKIKDEIISNLEKVVDPEIGINIVDLGLIYNLTVDKSGDVDLLMTLTAPNCPYGEEIIDMSELACKKVSDVGVVSINLTFNPPWSPDKISDAAKYYMGIL